MKNKRIILDTNLWISFLISKSYNEIDILLQRKGFRLLFSEKSLEEFIEVVKRPKLKKLFAKKDVELLFSFFDQYGELVNIKSEINVCRDPKDSFLLNMALDGKADFLITGDKDLLVLEKISTTRIITYNDFIEETKADGNST